MKTLCVWMSFLALMGVVFEESDAFTPSSSTLSSRRALPATNRILLLHPERSTTLQSLRLPASFPSESILIPRGGALTPWSIVKTGTRAVLSSITGLAGWIGSELGALNGKQKILFAAFFLTGFLLGKLKPFWRRFTQVTDIPSSWFGATGPVLSGRAVKVTDGDTIRFLHMPTPFHPKTVRKGKKEKLSSVALPIRICTIDTPKTAKFGKKGQPFGEEAKGKLKELLENRPVKVRMLQADQYGRAVAQVFVRRWFFLKQFVDETMLKEGLAEVYRGGGAVYGPKGLDAYLELEEEARSSKTGMWKQGKKRESAAEYKRRTKA